MQVYFTDAIFSFKEKIIKKLASCDPKEQEHGQILADEILERKTPKEISEDGELKVKTDRSVINKYSLTESSKDPATMSQGKVFYLCTVIHSN